MHKRKSCRSKLEEVLAPPDSFYNVKQEVTPKAPMCVMRSFAAAIYMVCLAVFVVLIAYQSKQRTLESVLSKKTMDGYDCRMLTKYNTAPKVQFPAAACSSMTEVAVTYKDVDATYSQCVERVKQGTMVMAQALFCSGTKRSSASDVSGTSISSGGCSELPECGTDTYPCLKDFSFYMQPTEITLAGAGDAEGTITYGQINLRKLEQGSCSLMAGSSFPADPLAYMTKTFLDPETLCGRFNSMPPYSCTRLVRKDTLDVISSAFANTELVYVVLATLVGLAFVSCYRKENPNKPLDLELQGTETSAVHAS